MLHNRQWDNTFYANKAAVLLQQPSSLWNFINTYIKRRIPLDCRFPFTLLYPSYPIYIPCGINGLPLWYKIDLLANVLSWHILTSFSYSWTIMWYLFNMPANVNLNLYPALLSPTFLSHSNTGLFFSSIVKAYSLGTFICHTTDILSYCFF